MEVMEKSLIYALKSWIRSFRQGKLKRTTISPDEALA